MATTHPTESRAPHPLILPPDVGHEPYNPIRDDRQLSPTEDLDRMPDGVPHSIVGLTALFSAMLAVLVGFMFFMGGTTTKVAAGLIVLMAIPVLVSTLRNKSERERNHVHPSR